MRRIPDSLLRLDHDDPFHPGEFRKKFFLQALDQGYPGHVSPPAETHRRDLDSAALDARKGYVTCLGPKSFRLVRDDRLDLFDVSLFQNSSEKSLITK
jgi:hypothetical protein